MLAFLWHFVPVYPHEKDLMAFHSRCLWWYFWFSITEKMNIVSLAAKAAVNLRLDRGGWRALSPQPSSWCCLTNKMQIMERRAAKYHSISQAVTWRCVFFPPNFCWGATVIHFCCSSQEPPDRKQQDPDFDELFTLMGLLLVQILPSFSVFFFWAF